MLKLKDLITLSSVTVALIALALALNRFPAAPLLIFVCIALDWLDGAVARTTRTSNDFGRELDSLADVVAFGVVPATFFLIVERSAPTLIAAIAYVACGAIRLAQFNLQREAGVYFGLPITASAAIAIAAYYFVQQFAWLVLLALSAAMIARVRIPKIG